MATRTEDLQTRSQVVAANIRARMAWLDMSRPDLAEATGIARRTLFDRLEGIKPFNDEQLWLIAEVFELANPGPLFDVPPGFPPLRLLTVRKSARGLLSSTYRQLRRSEDLFDQRLLADPVVGGLCKTAA